MLSIANKYYEVRLTESINLNNKINETFDKSFNSNNRGSIAGNNNFMKDKKKMCVCVVSN